ncbi:MAG: hypothetical protein ACKPA7_09085 [Sphaerospermopsis kisseleviana]
MPQIIITQQQRTAQQFTEQLNNEIKLEMVSIPGGVFQMGTDNEEIERLCKEYDVE